MPNILSICQPDDLSQSLQSQHFIVVFLCHITHQYVNLSTCHHVYKVDTLCLVIFAYISFVCHPVDFAPCLHSRQYLRYTVRHIYANLSPCHHLYKINTLVPFSDLFPTAHQYVNLSTCVPL